MHCISAEDSAEAVNFLPHMQTRSDVLSSRMMHVSEDLAGDWRRLDETQLRMHYDGCDGAPICLSVAPCSGPSKHDLETPVPEAAKRDGQP
jgi:hypothetical protein